ncbi:MAG: DMT family transporter [Desulfovibrio sp.]|nr:DMT family transporter [Desulfovibrio sp.]
MSPSDAPAAARPGPLETALWSLPPLAAGAMWGGAGCFVRILAGAGLTSQTVLFARVSAGALLLLAGMALCRPGLLKFHADDLWLFAGAGVLGIVGLNLCYNEAVLAATLPLAAVLLNLAPVFVVVLAALFFKERPSRRTGLCCALALAGGALAAGLADGALNAANLSGVLFGLASALFFALYGIFAKASAGSRGISVFTVLLYSQILASLAIAPFADIGLCLALIRDNPGPALAFACVHSACTAVLPYAFYTSAMRRLDAGRVSMLAGAAEPLAAAAFGAMLYGEVLSPLAMAGALLAILAVSLLFLPERKA